ncbi:hypothetical protein [Streptomyces sp. NPDC005486]|uniref:hypothetical protein n=1 Tax=Streptomyces sp. NPDC005486 TaxID=3155345 RepID=UPI0033AF8DCD
MGRRRGTGPARSRVRPRDHEGVPLGVLAVPFALAGLCLLTALPLVRGSALPVLVVAVPLPAVLTGA